jgi:MinD-like ATPase involved in chromosome partitioning or flagellar assembly
MVVTKAALALVVVVVISLDVAGNITSTSNFLKYAQMLKGKGLLQQVIINKCRLLSTARN